MIISVYSDVGKVRKINQDAYFCSEFNEIPLFAVADGMGGHKAGEVASSIAVETVNKILYNRKDEILNGNIEMSDFINEILIRANEDILSTSKLNESYYGMGTTITLATIDKNNLYIGHLGDSRAYLFRNGNLTLLTEDHSLVNELLKNGTISENEARNHPQKNVITKALGTEKNISADIVYKKIDKNDIIILCTDGLTKMVSEDSILETLILEDDIKIACKRLIDQANELGGFDNTTIMIIKID